MMPAEGNGEAVGRSGRKSRANAGARLKDILQHEAKDLKTLEAEADEEHEETTPAAGTKKARQRQQPGHAGEDAAPPTMNGVSHAARPGPPPAHETADAAAAAGKAEPAGTTDGACQQTSASKARKKPAAAAGSQPAATDLAAAAANADAAAPTRAAPTINTPLPRLPRPVRGADEGPGAALGQALGAADACWSISKDAAGSSKQQPQQQRGTKRKRPAAGRAGTPPPEGATEAGTEDGEDAPSSNGSLVIQQPAGKVLPVSARPAWLVQAIEGGSSALNKRQVRGLVDDLSQPQQVEFMLGCSACEYQQHGCAECRVQPEVTRPMARWQPDSGHPQVELAEPPTFTPSKEEFADPFAYIAGIAEQFVKQGMAKIVPPAGCWAPPPYVQQLKAACSGSSGGSAADELTFSAQRQFLNCLCMRGGLGADADRSASAAPTAAAAGASSSSQQQGPSAEQLLGADVDLLVRLDKQAAGGPAALTATAADGQSALQSSSCAAGSSKAGEDTVMHDAAGAAVGTAGGSSGLQSASAVIKHEHELLQQGQQHEAQQPSMLRTHTLRSFAAYADWAKRMHFSCQPCNAELQAVLQPGASQGRQRQGSTAGLPPAKRVKPDPDQQPPPSRDTATEAEGTEDTDIDGAAESSKDAAQQQQPPAERHSSRLQAKGRTPLHPLKSLAGAGRGVSPEPTAVKAKASKAAASTTSATPPTTPRTKAVKSGSGSRLVGAAAGMLGLAAVFPDSATSIDQFEAEFWRVVEQQQPGRLVEALQVPDLCGSSGGSLVQELQEQQAWVHDEQQQEQGGGEAGPWDLSSLPCRRENLLRYLPLQQSIPGLTEPVLGLTSCLSTSCWRVTPQGMYGISCLHAGAPRLWYAAPESACEAFQVAVQDCLPHLFAGNPALLQQATTAVSPNELRARGVPICRLVQEPGTLVVLLPNAFHSWVSTGFSIHESVALAPWDCLGAGCDAERSCRQRHSSTPVSQTELLVTLVSSCRCVADAQGPGGGDIEAEADEAAAAVAEAALAVLDKAHSRQARKSAKKQPQQQQQQQQQQHAADTERDAQPDEQVDQHAAAAHASHKQQQGATRQQHKQRQRHKDANERTLKGTVAESGGGSNSHSAAGGVSDSETLSAQSQALGFDSSSGSGDSSSSSSDGSDSETEASQPCWGAAAGAQQLLEPGLAWASGACASAALELVPKPAVLAAVGELVLRVEEEQCWQATARQFGVQQEQRMHGATLPVSHCGVCRADLWLSAVISSTAPGQAVCPEHAAGLSADPSTCTLLFRHSVEELQRLLFEAAALFPGCADDIRAAQQRVRARPLVRGLKSLGPLMKLPEELPPPRAPELKPGAREAATPVADWVKQLMALAQARLPLVGHGGAARLSHRQRRAAVEEALQVAAAAFEAVKAGGSIDGINLGQKLPVRQLHKRDEAVRVVVQQLMKQGSKASNSKAASSRPSKAVKGKSRESQQQQQQQPSDGSDSEEESDEQQKEQAALQPRQRKLPGWLQSECVVDKSVAKRAKAGPAAAAATPGGGSKAGKAGGAGAIASAERSSADAKAAAAAAATAGAATVSFSLADALPLAEQALEAVATKRALARQEKQRQRRQQEQRRRQLQQEQQQEQWRQRQQEHRLSNGVPNAAAQLQGQHLQQLQQPYQQQQLLALQQHSQQLLLAAAPASHHRPPHARASRESLREAGGSGGRGKGRSGGRGAGARGDRRSSGSGGRRSASTSVAGVGTEQQQQLAAQLTLQQLQLQAQFRAAALAAAAAAAGQGAPAAATVPAVSSAAAAAAAGAQLGQAGAAGVPGFVGFPGPLITMHNGVPVLIFAAPLPQQSNSAAATASADPAAQSAAAAAAAPAEAGVEVQQQPEQQLQPQAQAQAQASSQQAQTEQQPAAEAPPASSAATDAAATAGAAPTGSTVASIPALPPPAPAAAATGTSAAPAVVAPAVPAAGTSSALATAGSSSGTGEPPTPGSSLLPASSLQHNSGQLTDAEAAAAAAQAEAEAVASRAAAEAVAAAAAEARLVAGIVGNGHHHTQAPAVSMPPPGALAGASAPMTLQQQDLTQPLPAHSAAPVAADAGAEMPGTTAAATLAPSMLLPAPGYQPWQPQQQALPQQVGSDAAQLLSPAAVTATPGAAMGGYLGSANGSQAAGLAVVGGSLHHLQQGATAAPAGPDVECLLEVEEFFHSQEPGHVDEPAAAAAAASLAGAQQPTAAATGPAPAADPAAQQVSQAVSGAAPAPAPAPAPALPPSATDVGAAAIAPCVPQEPATTTTSAADQGTQLVSAETGEAKAAAAVVTPASGAPADGDAQGAAAAGATAVAPPAPVTEAGGKHLGAPVVLAGATPAAAQQSGPAAAAAAVDGGVGVVRRMPGCDDQMDELELEPLVDGMDDFDW